MAEILRVREAFAYDVGGATVVASPGSCSTPIPP